MLYLASDHGGLELKEKIKNFLEKKEIKYVDLGPNSYNPDDDYPIFAQKLGEAVVQNNGKGIGICKSGVGMNIAVNKIDGVRGFQATSVHEAKMSRIDDDTNLIVFGANEFDDKKDWEVLDTWLNTNFSGEERHIRRLGEIKKYEEAN
jgi:ribose 5-phosphate isomerase B